MSLLEDDTLHPCRPIRPSVCLFSRFHVISVVKSHIGNREEVFDGLSARLLFPGRGLEVGETLLQGLVMFIGGMLGKTVVIAEQEKTWSAKAHTWIGS